jgi:hypothetical protein
MIGIGLVEDTRMQPSKDFLHFEEWSVQVYGNIFRLTNAPAYLMDLMNKVFME